jgi:DNA-binding transcriptional MerR regulator
MEEDQTTLSMEKLGARVGVSPRTIRFYITEGLLPGAVSRGKAAAYTEEHLIRLRLIRRLSERHVPLAEMRTALEGLSLEEAATLLAEEDARAWSMERAARAESPRDYVAGLLEQARAARAPEPRRTQPSQPGLPSPHYASIQEAPPSRLALRESGEHWRRWELAPGVELQVREDVTTSAWELIERILGAAEHAGDDLLADE